MFCCGSHSLAKSRAEEKAQSAREAEARHARIESIISQPPRAYVVDRPLFLHEEHVEAPPPYSAAVAYSSPSAMIYDEKDEKQAIANTMEMQESENNASRPNRDTEGSVSDGSSVISIPSTQVTGLGSMHTGATVRREGARASDEYSSRPPSYYARSIDRRNSNSSSLAPGQFLRHPVMRDGWLEDLSRDNRSMYGE